MEFAALLMAIGAHLWAIDPRASRPLISSVVLAGREESKKLTTAQDSAIRSKGSVAVIPVHGPMFHRASEMAERWFGVTSTERVTREVRSAANDSAISAILLHIDSPGGSIYGLEELSAAIMAARGTKPVIAFADPMAASAAYWIGSQATEFVVAPGGDVGSIGVISMHEDLSGMLEMLGVNLTLITAGKHKGDANPFEPLSDEARDHLQDRVNDAFAEFVSAVATGRGVQRSAVISNFGQGRIVGAKAALKAGMVDRIATFTDTLTRFSAPRAADRERRAALARVKASA